MSIAVQELGLDNSGALAELAWQELVEEAEKCLPLMVTDNGRVLQGKEEIEVYLDKVRSN